MLRPRARLRSAASGAPRLRAHANFFGRRAEHQPEVAILSTCNRMEIYCAANDVDYEDHHLENRAFEWLAAQNNVKQNELKPYIYSAKESDAVKHAFRVGSGLDSMVLGETQILGQMKKAIENASQVGTLGPFLKPLFDKTFSVAKVVRGNTQIGAHSVSMAGASVKLGCDHTHYPAHTLMAAETLASLAGDLK